MNAGDLTELEVQTGRASAQPLPLVLSAGPLRCALQEGAVRWIRFHGVEVVRGVYAAVRDRNWGTVPASLHDLHIRTRDESFTVGFRVDHQAKGIAFSWQGRVEATARSLTFSFDGEARSGFLRNRIGFCVLHPPGCAGQACTVTHTDGRITESHFPRHVAPNQPFLNMRVCGVALRAAHGVRVLLGNLSDSSQQVRLSGRTPMRWRGRRLDAGVAHAAAMDPEGFHAEAGSVQHPEFELPAYSVLRLDGSAST